MGANTSSKHSLKKASPGPPHVTSWLRLILHNSNINGSTPSRGTFGGCHARREYTNLLQGPRGMGSCDVVISREYFKEGIPVLVKPNKGKVMKRHTISNICLLQKHLWNSTEQKGKSHLLSSRLCDDTLEFLLCSHSAQFDFYPCRTQEMALTQNLHETQHIRRKKHDTIVREISCHEAVHWLTFS